MPDLSRRPRLLAILLAASASIGGIAPACASSPDPWALTERDPIHTELVLQLVVTCSTAEAPAPSSHSKDGDRSEIWPIVGGRFVGKGIRGTVVPGGGDFPVRRPDGVEVIDALYRLKTDDGVTIIIHNVGLTYPGRKPGEDRYRMAPQFIAPVGKYDWLNRSLFIATLTDAPKGMELAKGPNQNDRLIQVYRVL